jgi:hypothetical protein
MFFASVDNNQVWEPNLALQSAQKLPLPVDRQARAHAAMGAPEALPACMS